MKRGVVFFLGLVFSCFVLTVHAAAPAGQDDNPASTFEQGTLYRYGKITVVDLHGTYFQMGRQYGKLLNSDLKLHYKSVIEDFFLTKGKASKEGMLKEAYDLYRLYPKHWKDFIKGMAEATDLSTEQHLLLNAVEFYIDLVDTSFLQNSALGFLPDTTGCSAIAAWGEYTSGKPLVFGRNYDFIPFYKLSAPFFTVTVFHPADGSIPFATMTYTGTVYVTNGMNREGLFVELNNAGASGGMQSYKNRIQLPITIFSFLTGSDSMEQLDGAIHTSQTDFAYNLNAASPDVAYSYEWPTFGIKRRSGEFDGLLVATNHFVDKSWGIYEPDPENNTIERRENLLSLGQQHKGKFSVDIMKKILDTPVTEGGVTFPALTIYQIIAVPEELTVLIKLPGIQDWTEIDIKGLLKKEE